MSQSDTPTTEVDTSTSASSLKHELPFVNRPRPRAHGVGRFGVGKHDDRDDTRYAWTRVVPPVAALLFALLFPSTVRATTNPYCETLDSLTSVYGFCKPAVDVEGATEWGLKENQNWQMNEDIINAINTSTTSQLSNITALSASTVSLNALKVDKAGATITGQLTIVNSSITVNGANGNILSLASVTASGFFGDGSKLTGIPSTTSISGFYVPYTGATSGRNVVLGNNNLSTSYGITATTMTASSIVSSPLFSGDNLQVLGLNYLKMGTTGGDVTLEPGGIGIAPTAFKVAVTGKNVTAAYGVLAGSVTLSGGTLKLWARTKAQIDVLSAASVGEFIDCTDCTLPGICRSTGTLASQWRKIESSTLGCGTNN